MKTFLMFLSLLLPWEARRRFLERQFGYTIHPLSRIGFAWILPRQLIMEEGASIGHLTLCKNISLLHLKTHSSIGNGNWITGFPLGPSPHFAEETDRQPQLIVGEHSAITHRHLIDCTNSVTIGKFTTFAGFRSQILTHTIDLERNRQTSSSRADRRLLFCRNEFRFARRKRVAGLLRPRGEIAAQQSIYRCASSLWRCACEAPPIALARARILPSHGRFRDLVMNRVAATLGSARLQRAGRRILRRRTFSAADHSRLSLAFSKSSRMQNAFASTPQACAPQSTRR